ncbi:MAG: XdhC/CoxI family protein [Thermodesulfovibrionales bacterium]|nr:XdhC/CoxI family protein [Thermodesulfovibrionales bacterium]
MDIYEEILRLKRDGRPAALATIVESTGSTPQKKGAKILVRDDGSVLGTLGGGCLEAEVIQACLMAIKDSTPRTLPFELTEKHGGLVCGGKVLVYIEPIIPEPSLIILGAGHVGKALSKIAKFSGFSVTVVDDRQEHANRENFPDADRIIINDFETIFKKYPVSKSDFIVIATRGHNHDLEALKSALETEARYIGLLGSRRKKALLFKALADQGFSQEDINRVITPVGLEIGSVTPEEIAISIIAQIIQIRRQDGSSGFSSSSCSRFSKKDWTDKTAPSFG